MRFHKCSFYLVVEGTLNVKQLTHSFTTFCVALMGWIRDAIFGLNEVYNIPGGIILFSFTVIAATLRNQLWVSRKIANLFINRKMRIDWPPPRWCSIAVTHSFQKRLQPAFAKISARILRSSKFIFESSWYRLAMLTPLSIIMFRNKEWRHKWL